MYSTCDLNHEELSWQQQHLRAAQSVTSSTLGSSGLRMAPPCDCLAGPTGASGLIISVQEGAVWVSGGARRSRCAIAVHSGVPFRSTELLLLEGLLLDLRA